MNKHSDTASSINGRAIARRWLRRAGIVTLGAVGTYLTACVGAAYPLSSQLIRPRLKRLRQLESGHLRRFLAARGVVYEEISFQSLDGTRLTGWWFAASPAAAETVSALGAEAASRGAEGDSSAGADLAPTPAGAGRPTVIALHGVTKNRTDMVRFAISLATAGINVLLFDGRGHGGSDRRFVTYGFHERRDVEAAIDFAVARGADAARIGLAGVSMGAAISLQVAAANRRVRAVWTDSPFSSLARVSMDRLRFWTGMPEASLLPLHWAALAVAERRGHFDASLVDPLGLASQITCPVYLVHGDGDRMIGVEHSMRIFDALPGSEKHLWVVPGAAHGKGFRRSTSEYAERLVAFFRGAFGE